MMICSSWRHLIKTFSIETRKVREISFKCDVKEGLAEKKISELKPERGKGMDHSAEHSKKQKQHVQRP